MVSGLVTSPWLHSIMSSALATERRTASKSAILSPVGYLRIFDLLVSVVICGGVISRILCNRCSNRVFNFHHVEFIRNSIFSDIDVRDRWCWHINFGKMFGFIFNVLGQYIFGVNLLIATN